MTRKSWGYLVVSLVIVTTVFLLAGCYNFLSRTHPGKHDILVVEGWLDTNALEKAKVEFLNNRYKLLITTGFIFSHGYLMGSDGKTVFYTGHIEKLHEEKNSITLTIRGTKARGEFPHFRIFADTFEIGSSYTTRRKHTFEFHGNSLPSIDSVSVVFDNDDYSRYRDRNLYLYELTVNGKVFPANSEKVSLYGIRGGKYFFRRKLSKSTATEAASYLVRAGIHDSLVFPVESLDKIRSKTYTSGLDLKQWLEQHDYLGKRNVTIFTQGLHARRTYISFRKALTSAADLGIIACSDELVSPSNWWKTLRGWREVLYETAGLFYVTFFI